MIQVLFLVAGVWLIAGLIGAIWLPFREPERLDVLPTGAPGRFVDVGGHRVHVIERGAGPAVVLVHGTGGSAAIWPEEVLAALAEDHRVIVLDLFGWGFSERDPSFPYGFAFWSTQLYDTLQVLGVERAAIVGHSLGAAVSVMFAAQHPEVVTHLVVSGNGEMLAPMYFAMLAPGVGKLVLVAQEVPVKTYSDEHYALEQAAYRIRGTRHALLTNAWRTLLESKAFFAAYPQVQAPVLQIHGTKDEEIPVWAMRKTHARFPEGRKQLVLIEGSKHFVMWYATEEYTRTVRDFLDTE